MREASMVDSSLTLFYLSKNTDWTIRYFRFRIKRYGF